MATQHSRVQSRNQDGQILVLTTVSMVALLGVMALSLDASFMFEKRNRLHAAADAAAKSAAYEIIRNPTVALTSLEKFADQQVIAHGFLPTRQGGTTSVVVNHGPSAGPFAGNVNYVEAVVSESTSTFFAQILGWFSMTPLATAVAGAGNPGACMILKEDLTIGNTTLTLNGCGVAVGDDLIGENPNSRITGTPLPPVGVTDSCSGPCGQMGDLTMGAPLPDDPLLGLAAPTAPDPATCVAGTGATLNAGCYTGIAASVTTLNSGIYYVTGIVDIGNLSGNNVLIYLAPGGRLQAGNNQQLHLTGRTSGPYTGIAIFQDPSNTSNFDAANHFTLDVNGAIYMPGADVDFANHLTFTAGACNMFIAKSLKIRNGSGSVSNTGCAAMFGGAAFLTASIAQ
jgi:Flp pilus assembly protein TadG